MKKLLVFSLMMLSLVSILAAGWEHSEIVLNISRDDSVLCSGLGDYSGTWYCQTGMHGVVVDKLGRFWIAMHDSYGPDKNGDVEFLANGDTCHYKPLYCINPDGTNASFSPITKLEFPDGTIDTLYGESVYNGSGKGISLDQDGNILYTAWSTVYKIDYETGEGIARFIPSSTWASMTEAVVDTTTGEIYCGYVLSGNVMYKMDKNMTASSLETIMDTRGWIARSIAIRRNEDASLDMYFGSTWNGLGVVRVHTNDPDMDPYEIVDTLGNFETITVDGTEYTDVKLWAESLDWTPDGNLLVGTLHREYSNISGSRWYIMDPETGEMLDTIGVAVDDSLMYNADYTVAGGVLSGRGGFFTDANTLYTVDFYTGTLDKWVYSDTDVKAEKKNVPTSYNLSQNYPNPFNPTTVIPFSIDKKANVKLVIYDMLGHEVGVALDNTLNAGNYNINFNASNLSSGVYIYQLNVDGNQISKSMIYLK